MGIFAFEPLQYCAASVEDVPEIHFPNVEKHELIIVVSRSL
ncbi:hypothetical protein ACP4OV_009921 [Aristida adscensionis]